VEEIYQKKSQLEHILLRPDTYVGSIEKQTQEVWVQEGTGVVFKKVTYTPALYKIFDEIIVNAIDNKVHVPAGREAGTCRGAEVEGTAAGV
jgi:DNA topoisomerase-2